MSVSQAVTAAVAVAVILVGLAVLALGLDTGSRLNRIEARLDATTTTSTVDPRHSGEVSGVNCQPSATTSPAGATGMTCTVVTKPWLREGQ